MNRQETDQSALVMRNVVCICDDSDLLEQVCLALDAEEFRGYIATVRTEVHEVESILHGDVFLIDEALGAVDNWDISRQIRTRCDGRDIVILALVKDLGSDLLAQVRGLGLDGFIRKDGVTERLAPGLKFLARNIPEREIGSSNSFKRFGALGQVLSTWEGGHFPQGGTRDPTVPPTGAIRPETGEQETDEIIVQQMVSYLSSGRRAASDRTRPIVINDIEAAMAGAAVFEDNGEDRKTISLDEESASEDDMTIMTDLSPTGTGTGGGKNRALAGDHELERELVGQMLGKVRLEALIGTGAGGAVYRGRHTNLDLPVAVKVLHPTLAQQDTDYAIRFMTEARMAARISHANVVRMLDCDRDDGRTNCYYIVMEFVSGKSLQDEIEHGGVPETRLMGMAIGIVHALVAASRQDVIHRDIKPENIMLDEDDMVKVADLGLAKRIQRLAGLGTTRMRSRFAELTDRDKQLQGAAIVGTPHYMAPEAITDPSSVDMRADIYSLGATLYHAITGRTMFESGKARDILMHQVNDDPPAPHEITDEASKTLSKIIMRMLAKDPAQRPPSHRDLLGVFRAHRETMLVASGARQKGLGKLYRRLTGG